MRLTGCEKQSTGWRGFIDGKLGGSMRDRHSRNLPRFTYCDKLPLLCLPNLGLRGWQAGHSRILV